MPNKAAALWTVTAALMYLCHGQHLLRRLTAPIAQRSCRLSLGHSKGHERLHVCDLPAAPGLVQADLLLPLEGRGTCSIQGRQAKLLPSDPHNGKSGLHSATHVMPGAGWRGMQNRDSEQGIGKEADAYPQACAARSGCRW